MDPDLFLAKKNGECKIEEGLRSHPGSFPATYRPRSICTSPDVQGFCVKLNIELLELVFPNATVTGLPFFLTVATGTACRSNATCSQINAERLQLIAILAMILSITCFLSHLWERVLWERFQVQRLKTLQMICAEPFRV